MGIFQAIRFIPTYVGFTPGLAWCPAQTAVHPHVCGVYGHGVHSHGVALRFIPTYVGFTHRDFRRPHVQPVHPHVCGVYLGSDVPKSVSSGSSPRMWGLRVPEPTPEGAGAVHPHVCGVYGSCFHWPRRPAVHPHVCGVYGVEFVCYGILDGSSPRMWGLRVHLLQGHGVHRFIPTYVGFTVVKMQFLQVGVGSSPRMWGLRWRAACSAAMLAVHPHVCGVYWCI